MQLPKARWLSLLLCGTLLASSCVPISSTPLASQKTEAISPYQTTPTPPVSQRTEVTSPYQTEEVAYAIQQAYFEGNTAAYRVSLFVIYQEMRLQGIDTIAVRVGELLDYMKSHGADGLEPLLVAYIDAVASGGDQKIVSTVLGEISNSGGSLVFHNEPLINIAVPFERWLTPVVLDVRGDAIRQIAVAYVSIASNETTPTLLPTLEELLNKENAHIDLCKLPILKDQTDNVHPSDLLRQQNCANTSSPGGEQGGAIASSVGTFLLGACLNALPMEADTMRVRYLDAATCSAEKVLDGSYPFTGGSERRQPPQHPTLTTGITVAGVAAVVGIAAGIITLLEWVKGMQDPEVKKATEEYFLATEILAEEVNGLEIAISDYETAITISKKAAEDKEAAGKNYSEALADLNRKSFDPNVDSKAVNAAMANADQKKTEYEEALGKAQKADEEVRKAEATKTEALEKAKKEKENAEEARKKLDEAKKNNTHQPEPSEDEFEGGACDSTVFGLPNLRSIQLDRFLEEFNSMKSCNPAALYSPDDPRIPCAPSSLELSICSFDDNTVFNESGLCRLPIVCENGNKPDKLCRCSLPDDTKTIQGMGCTAAICPHNTIPVSTVMGCSCQSIDNPDKPLIFPPLFPLSPLETLLQIENPKKVDLDLVESEFESKPLETWGKNLFWNQTKVGQEMYAEPIPETNNAQHLKE